MIDFFNSLSDMLIGLVHFVTNLIHGLLNVSKLVPQALTYINYVNGFMPSEVVIFTTAAITISIVFLIINR